MTHPYERIQIIGTRLFRRAEHFQEINQWVQAAQYQIAWGITNLLQWLPARWCLVENGYQGKLSINFCIELFQQKNQKKQKKYYAMHLYAWENMRFYTHDPSIPKESAEYHFYLTKHNTLKAAHALQYLYQIQHQKECFEKNGFQRFENEDVWHVGLLATHVRACAEASFLATMSAIRNDLIVTPTKPND